MENSRRIITIVSVYGFFFWICIDGWSQCPVFSFRNLNGFIENPRCFTSGQTRGHAPLAHFESVSDALSKEIDSSGDYLSLNGNWSFKYLTHPALIDTNFVVPDYQTSGWDSISVPSNWEMKGFGDPKFRNIAQPFKVDPPFVPDHDNPVACYRRQFVMPDRWIGKRLYLHFEAAASAAFVWVNGKFIGYNEGAYEPFEFDISEVAKSGLNHVAVAVLKYCDGTYLEDQDTWRLSGIFRPVYVYAMNPIHINDYFVKTDFDDNYNDAELSVDIDIMNLQNRSIQELEVVASLFDEDRKLVKRVVSKNVLRKEAQGKAAIKTKIENPLKWSAEKPHLYSLVLELMNREECLSRVSTKVGFREVEVKDQVFTLNGIPIKLNGINSHMQHPESGKAVDMATMKQDFEIFKRFNINCVRTSHYPPDRQFLHLADEYGVYVIDEAGNEAHATEFLSNKANWREAYIERVENLVLRDRNHPSVIIWSAGNESGWGDNLCATIARGKSLDPTRPAWLYGGNRDEDPTKNPIACEDIIGPRYDTPFELETLFGQVGAEKDTRPSFMDEYVAATGNGLGGMDEYWEVIRKYPRLLGGAIWDFVSPGLTSPVRLLEDKSPNKINVAILGNAELNDGSIELEGHDTWVEVYNDRVFDSIGTRLTIAARVFPYKQENNVCLIGKGSNQFGIGLSNDSIEFYITTVDQQKVMGSDSVLNWRDVVRRNRVAAKLPTAWQGRWHNVKCIYDERLIYIYIDDVVLASHPCKGFVKPYPYAINVGRNSEIHGQEYSGYLFKGKVDEVVIFNDAIYEREYERASASLLSIDFKEEANAGTFYSMGIGGRTYGTIWPDRSVQPEMHQLKKSAQPVQVRWRSKERNEILIYNHHAFTNLSELQGEWKLMEDTTVLQKDILKLELAPGRQKIIALPVRPYRKQDGKEYRIEISYSLKGEKPWAPAGFEVAWEQLDMDGVVHPPAHRSPKAESRIVSKKNGDEIIVDGDRFQYTFSISKGTLIAMRIDGHPVIGTGPVPNVWRAPLANELDEWTTFRRKEFTFGKGMGNDLANVWRSEGLNNLVWTTLESQTDMIDGKCYLRFRQFASAQSFGSGFLSEIEYQIYSDGFIEIVHELTPAGTLPAWLPRVGVSFDLDPSLINVSWYGRGPHENYPDRKTGSKIGIYNKQVNDFYEPYLMPQDHGLRTDNRWLSVKSIEGYGVTIYSDELFNFNIYKFSTDNLSRANYPFQLRPIASTTLNIDYATTGVGCTAVSVLNQHRASTVPYKRTIYIAPIYKDGAPN